MRILQDRLTILSVSPLLGEVIRRVRGAQRRRDVQRMARGRLGKPQDARAPEVETIAAPCDHSS
jgi:hypothetical protein